MKTEFVHAAPRTGQDVRIVTDPTICGGRPTIRGTRMRIADILDMLASGAERADILADFNYLADEDISAALSYAARAADHHMTQVFEIRYIFRRQNSTAE